MPRPPRVVVLAMDLTGNAFAFSPGGQCLIGEGATNPIDGIGEEPHELAPGRSDASKQWAMPLDARQLIQQLLTLLAGCGDVEPSGRAVDRDRTHGRR